MDETIWKPNETAREYILRRVKVIHDDMVFHATKDEPEDMPIAKLSEVCWRCGELIKDVVKKGK